MCVSEKMTYFSIANKVTKIKLIKLSDKRSVKCEPKCDLTIVI